MAGLPEGVDARTFRLRMELGVLGDCLASLMRARRGEPPLLDLRSYLRRYRVLGPEPERMVPGVGGVTVGKKRIAAAGRFGRYRLGYPSLLPVTNE